MEQDCGRDKCLAEKKKKSINISQIPSPPPLVIHLYYILADFS